MKQRTIGAGLPFAGLLVAGIALLSGCAAITPTVETTRPAPAKPAPAVVTPPSPPVAPPVSPQAEAPPPVAKPRPPVLVHKPEELVFLDRFEYVARRDDLNVVSVFQKHGWSWAKTQQAAPGRRPGGYLYTTAAIPGYHGAFPGRTSKRVLAMDILPSTSGGQTDFYLQYGNGEDPAYDNTIPGNVWFQFWMYINHHGEQRSGFDRRNKFIYPCNGPYPCRTHKWLMSIEPNSYIPYWRQLATPTKGEVFVMTGLNIFGVSEVNNRGAEQYDNGKLGHTNRNDFFPLQPNRWTLVKIHYDTSTPSGVYEVWLRAADGPWAKVVEWIDGVTPGFSWRIRPEHVGGHRVIRMPTTFSSSGRDADRFNAWIYLDDFAIARSEAGLPQY